MGRGALVALGIAAGIALTTWGVLQITTDIGVLTWLGIAGGLLGAVVAALAFLKLPAQRPWLAGGAVLGAAFAGLIVYQTFFAVSDEFKAKKQDVVETQQQLDAAFDDAEDDF
jgi:hypothetical protein